MTYKNKELSEEGVGFGVPVLKFGNKTIFPGYGSMTTGIQADSIAVDIEYHMNLVERMVILGRELVADRLAWSGLAYSLPGSCHDNSFHDQGLPFQLRVLQ